MFFQTQFLSSSSGRLPGLCSMTLFTVPVAYLLYCCRPNIAHTWYKILVGVAREFFWLSFLSFFREVIYVILLYCLLFCFVLFRFPPKNDLFTYLEELRKEATTYVSLQGHRSLPWFPLLYTPGAG